MQNLYDTTDYRPSLIGTIATGATAVGAPIDTLGFGSVLGIITAGAGYGTGANAATLNVKWQESASPTGTGSSWTDITNGTISGTMAFAAMAWTDITDPAMKQGKIFELLSDGTRLRYIRAHATMAGTAGSSPKYAVGAILGNPVDTVHYIQNPTSQATGNGEFTLGR